MDQAPLGTSVADLELALGGCRRDEVVDVAAAHGMTVELLRSAIAAREALGKISDLIHAAAIALSLPHILQPTERLMRPSLQRASDGLISLSPGSEDVRQAERDRRGVDEIADLVQGLGRRFRSAASSTVMGAAATSPPRRVDIRLARSSRSATLCPAAPGVQERAHAASGVGGQSRSSRGLGAYSARSIPGGAGNWPTRRLPGGATSGRSRQYGGISRLGTARRRRVLLAVRATGRRDSPLQTRPRRDSDGCAGPSDRTGAR